MAGAGWGTATVNPDGSGSLAVPLGEVAVPQGSLPSRSGTLTVSLNGTSIQSTCEVDGSLARFTFGSAQRLRAGDTLTVGAKGWWA